MIPDITLTSIEQDRIEAIGEQLRHKITSKFTAATFLAGFALAVITGQIFAIWQSTSLSVTFPGSVGLVFAAFILFIEAVLQLDGLTMPKRFWDEDPKSERNAPLSRAGLLTDQDLWNLRDQMIYYWQRLIVVAALVTFVAVVLMVLPMSAEAEDRMRSSTFISTVVGFLSAAYYCWLVRRTAQRKFPALYRPQD